MHDQWIVGRASLCRINLARRVRIKRISSQSLDRLRRKRDQFALCDQLSCLLHHVGVYVLGIDFFNYCIHILTLFIPYMGLFYISIYFSSLYARSGIVVKC